MAEKVSVSVSRGEVSERHSKRDYTPKSADVSLADRNVVVHSEDYREAWLAEFEPSIGRYNAQQKRDDRKKTAEGYLEDVRYGKRAEEWMYSYVLQIGNRDNLGVTDSEFDVDEWRRLRDGWDEVDEQGNVVEHHDGSTEDASAYVQAHLVEDDSRRRAKECLQKIAEGLPARYPNWHFTSLIIHDDEPNGTVHLDMNGFPVAGGDGAGVFKNGMDTRCSLNKALEQMGFKGIRGRNAIQFWQDDIKAYMEEVMAEYDLERQHMGNTNQHENTSQFELTQKLKAEAEIAEQARDTATAAYEQAAQMRSTALDQAEQALDERDQALGEVKLAKKILADQSAQYDKNEAAIAKQANLAEIARRSLIAAEFAAEHVTRQAEGRLDQMEDEVEIAKTEGYRDGYEQGAAHVLAREQEARDARQRADFEYEAAKAAKDAYEGAIDSVEGLTIEDVVKATVEEGMEFTRPKMGVGIHADKTAEPSLAHKAFSAIRGWFNQTNRSGESMFETLAKRVRQRLLQKLVGDRRKVEEFDRMQEQREAGNTPAPSSAMEF